MQLLPGFSFLFLVRHLFKQTVEKRLSKNEQLECGHFGEMMNTGEMLKPFAKTKIARKILRDIFRCCFILVES